MAHPTKPLFESIITSYDTLSSIYRTQYSGFYSRVLIDFERGRFWTREYVLGPSENTWAGGSIEDQSDVDLNSSQKLMLSIQNALHTAIKASERGGDSDLNLGFERNTLGPRELHRRLRQWNDTLQNLLPPSHRNRMEELWPQRMLPEDTSEEYQITGPTAGPSQRTVTKPRPTAAVKYMGQLRKQRRSSDGKDLFVDNVGVDIGLSFGEHSLGSYQPGEGTSESLVLVEWKSYDSRWTSSTGKELYERVGDLAQLLHQPEKRGRDWFRVLNCMGWLHDEPECRFGFVYEIPETPVSLHTLIAQSRTAGGRPPLGMKFQLAATLARCLHGVHGTIGWLHKNISAHNIIFSPSQGAMSSTASPYLIGFNHSRMDNERAFTEGPNTSNKHIEYQHPEYRMSDKRTPNRFHRIYDYYSLGIVLFEIGIWTPFNEISGKKSTLSPLELQNYLIKNAVPKLDGWMGTVYRDAVTACLKGDFGSRCRDESEEARLETLAEFESKVVQPLYRCFA